MTNSKEELNKIYHLADDYIRHSGDFHVVEYDKNFNADGFIYLCIGDYDEVSIEEMLEDFFKDEGYNIIATVNDYACLYLYDYYEFSVQFEFDDDDDEDDDE